MDIYQRLKVKTYINAWDAVSAYGSSRMEPETLAAMRDAASKYVPIRDLQQAVGRKIAQMTGNEAAYVVSGTAAGMLLAGPLQFWCRPLKVHLYDEERVCWYDIAVMAVLLIFCTMLLVNNTYNPFIYFRF